MLKEIVQLIIFSLVLPWGAFCTVFQTAPEGFKPKVEIAACFLEYQGQILLLHRQPWKVEGNLWGIPGGKVDKQETPLNAVIREVKEETGYQLTKESLEYLGKVYISNEISDYIYHMFRFKDVKRPGDVKISFSEHKGFTWVTPGEALAMNLMLDEDTCIKLIYPDCGEN